jgi:hypothetical protein
LAVAAIVAGATFRFVWVLALHQPFDYVYSDMAGYLGRAQELVDTASLRRYDAFSPPGVHLLLAGVFRIFGTGQHGLWAAAVLWAGLSAAAPFLMWRIARLLLTQTAAALTAIFTAFWPLHSTAAGYFLSETPSLTFLLGALWMGYASLVATGRRAVLLAAGAGVLGGIAVSMRPQFVLNLGILAGSWLLASPRLSRAIAAFASAVVLVICGVVAHNSVAAGQLTGISENSGITFFIGQCDVNTVYAAGGANFTAPPAAQERRGRFYNFPDHQIWDQGFFFDQGLDCIRSDGVSHLGLLWRSVIDLTATTVIWPQSNEPTLREVVKVANIAYVVLLPAIVLWAVVIGRERRRRGERPGELILLLHLATVLVTAVLFFGDPRYRMPYDFFGLALLAAIISYAFIERRQPSPVDSADA